MKTLIVPLLFLFSPVVSSGSNPTPIAPVDSPLSPAPSGADFLKRGGRDDIRIVAYNIWLNSVFDDPAASERFRRVIRALDADIWALQEVREKPEAVAAFFNEAKPLPDGKSWEARYAGSKTTVSRYPIVLHHWRARHGCGNSFVGSDLIDLPDQSYRCDLYVVNPSFSPFEGAERDADRQCQADQVAAWLREARNPGGSVELPPGTPIVLAGDFNMVGSLRPLTTLLEGDIVDEERFGPDSPPDWDGTGLADPRPVHNGTGTDTWTWRSDRSRWQPGRLDFILYTNSVAHLSRAFVLNTVMMDDAALEAAGLERFDVVVRVLEDGGLVFDHLPVVADLHLEGTGNREDQAETAVSQEKPPPSDLP